MDLLEGISRRWLPGPALGDLEAWDKVCIILDMWVYQEAYPKDRVFVDKAYYSLDMSWLGNHLPSPSDTQCSRS